MTTRRFSVALSVLAAIVASAGLAPAATTVYQEDFDSGYSGGALSGQNGWAGGGQQVASGGNYHTRGNNTDQQTNNTALYTLPSSAVSVIIESRMRMRGGWNNIMGPLDGVGAGDALFQYGANWNSNNYRVRDDGGANVVLTNVSGGNALSGSSHQYYDVRFIADLNGTSPATGLFQVKKDGQANYSTVASGFGLNLTAAHENPANWKGLFVRGRTGSDHIDTLSVSYVDAKAPTATVLADSAADWQGAAPQPHGQWSYGRYNNEANWQNFVQNTNYDLYGTWVGGDGYTWNVPGYPQISEYSAAPSNGDRAVRRWTSNTEGEVTVYYDAHRLQSGSTGQIVGIYQNGTPVWSQNLDNSNVHFMGSVPLTVHPGDQIDFTINSKGNNNSDWTHFSARIEDGPPHANPGLVAHWAMNEKSDMPIGSTGGGAPYNRRSQAGDSSGSNDHAQMYNMNSNDWVSGQIGNAIDFDGSNDYLRTSATNIGNGATELTLAMWIKPDDKDNWDGLLTNKAGDFTGIALADYISDGQTVYSPTFRVMNAGNVTSTTDTPVGQWSHVVAVWKSGEIHRIYIDGALGANNDAGAYNGAISMDGDDYWYIGTDRLIANRWYDGLIDDVGIWTRALSDTEILQLYVGGQRDLDLAHASMPDASVIPEPATMCAIGLALAGLGGYVRRRRNA